GTRSVGWVERRPRRGRAERAWRRETQQYPRAGRATLGLARALDLTYGELFAGLFDIVNLKTALRRSPHERQRHAGLLRRGESRRRLFRRVLDVVDEERPHVGRHRQGGLRHLARVGSRLPPRREADALLRL